MRKFALLLVAVLIVAGVWSGGWFYAAGQVRQAVATLGEGDGQTDPIITCGTLNVTGFPFRFDIECKDATIIAGDMTTTVAGVRTSVLVYSPTQAKFSALSPITIADAYSGAQSRIDFTGAEGSARLVTDDFWQGLGGAGWRIGRVSLVADGVNWVDTIVGETPLLSAAHLEAHLLDIPEQHNPVAGTSALAGFAKLTDAAAPSHGITGGEVSLEAELSGLPNDLRDFSSADVLQNWQAAGGQLKLVGLKGTAGDQFIESSGTLGLDSGARLDGQISLRHKGVVERLGTLIPEDWKGLILGGQEADGSYAQTVTIKAGIVFSGIVPVSVIPPLL
jgi:hypothetical protein